MKKSNKYNLLSKDEPNKEKSQQEWIEMESVNRWENKRNQNSDTSYVKFEEEYSQIEGDNVHLNSGNQNSSYVPSVNKNSQQYKPQPTNKDTQKLSSSNAPNINASKQPQQKPNLPSSTYQQPNKLPTQPQRNIQSSQMPPNPYNNQYGMNSQYVPQQSMINNFYPHRNVSVYEVANNQPRYSQYQPQGYVGGQNSQYGRQSQLNYPQYSQMNNYQSQIQQNQQYQNPMNSRVPQQYPTQPPVNTNIAKSSINRANNSSYRQSVPQMTVNCDKCTFTQSVPGNTQMYICCVCNQINECFPLYGVFNCGICMARVIYPYGTSTLIKCTKCQTVNRVNPQPKKKQDENVVMGKESSEQKEENFPEEENVHEILQQKMKRNQPEHYEEKPSQYMRKDPQQPFKVLPAQKKQQKQQEKQVLDLYPQVQLPKQQKRQVVERNIQFTEQLIDLDSSQKHGYTGNEHLHNQIFQLSQKLDESLVISKEQEKPVPKVQSPNKSQPLIKQPPVQNLDSYPSIFD